MSGSEFNSGLILVEPGDPRAAGPGALLARHHAFLTAEFPATSNHYLSVEALCGDDIRFFTARRGADVIGCAALAIRPGYGEVKSMFVDPAARGSGAAKALMRQLEDEARKAGLAWMRLESGDTLVAAHALYRASGFVACGPFGDYRADPRSVFMEKPLTAPGSA